MILGSWDPVNFRVSGSWVPSGCFNSGCRASMPGVLCVRIQARFSCSTGWAGVPMSLDPVGSSSSRCWIRCFDLSWHPVHFTAPGSQASSGCCSSWGRVSVPRSALVAGSNSKPGHVRSPWLRDSSGCCGTGCRASTQGLLTALVQTGSNSCRWLRSVSCGPSCWFQKLLV